MSSPPIRPADERDLARLLELLAACPEAAQWSAAQCGSAIAEQASLRCLVADSGLVLDGGTRTAAGMIVYRGPVAGEVEILNLAVDPESRRRGIGRALIRAACDHPADVYLEVRQSNFGGMAFYRRCGFVEAGYRKDYYKNPREDAVVMKRACADPSGRADEYAGP